jgi:hypothetical protein
MKYQLTLLTNGQRARTLRLKVPVTVIGRAKGSDIRIASHEVSRLHCRLQFEGDRLIVRDLGSANGTQVNGQPVVGERTLRVGDRIQVGPVQFVLEAEQAVAVDALAAIPVDDDIDEIIVIEDTDPAVAIPVEVVAEPPTPSRSPAAPPRAAKPAPAPVVKPVPPAAPAVRPVPPAARPTEVLPVAEVEEDEPPAQMAPPQALPAKPRAPAEEFLPFADLDESAFPTARPGRK